MSVASRVLGEMDLTPATSGALPPPPSSTITYHITTTALCQDGSRWRRWESSRPTPSSMAAASYCRQALLLLCIWPMCFPFLLWHIWEFVMGMCILWSIGMETWNFFVSSLCFLCTLDRQGGDIWILFFPIYVGIYIDLICGVFDPWKWDNLGTVCRGSCMCVFTIVVFFLLPKRKTSPSRSG